MDKEKLKAILSEIFGEDVAGELVDKATDTVFSEIENLVKVKDQLRKQARTLEKKLKDFDGVDLEEIESLRSELEELREAAESGQGESGKGLSVEEREAIERRAVKKVQDQLDALQKRYDSLDEQHQESVAKYHNTLIERDLRQAIKKTNVKSEAEDLIYKAFRSDAQVEVDDEGAEFVHFKNKDGLKLPPEEYLADWGKTDAAKEFIKAPENSGGGAHGGGSSGRSKSMTRVQFEALDPAARQKALEDKVEVIDG